MRFTCNHMLTLVADLISYMSITDRASFIKVKGWLEQHFGNTFVSQRQSYLLTVKQCFSELLIE